MSIQDESLAIHKKLRGKIALHVKAPVESVHDLSLQYTPGVGAVSKAIAEHPETVWDYTSRRNWVAVVTDGSAVLGLGNIGPEAALPVMEGKALLFKEFGGVDAFPICLDTQNSDEIVRIVTALAPSFGGINLEDIAAPRCFEIEQRLQDALDIPVFHDDQHGTAVVVMAGMLNALRVTGRDIATTRFVISGVGAAGTAVMQMLQSYGATHIIAVDSKGIISRERTDLNAPKQAIADTTNSENRTGSLTDAMHDADAFIGVSVAGIVSAEMVQSMHADPIIFALANPTPEVMPDIARAAGAAVIATGRSDFPNQVNNVLAFPGIFRGALDAGAKRITIEMQRAAIDALASAVHNPTSDCIIPPVMDRSVAKRIADAVRASAAL
jgi:malate dehydrogenase (oxaloacetate-decarboxylating)